MKLVKILSTVAIIAVLSACTTAITKPKPKKQPALVEKTVVYSCNNKPVTVTYQFRGKKATAAKVMLYKKVLAKSLYRDNTDKDFPSFVSNRYLWSVDYGFSLDNATETDGIMLTQRGKKVDKILAKNCKVNAEATAKASK